MRLYLVSSMALLALAGCANKAEVSPSQNPTLNAVSKSSATTEKPGLMQRSLDNWLKEEWNPVMASEPTTNTKTESDGTVVTTKTEPTQITVSTKAADGSTINKTTNATQITTTKQASDGTVTTTTEVVPLDEDNTPFTLQKYVDKWKAYEEKKAKMNEGKPKEPSHVEQMESLPVIGK